MELHLKTTGFILIVLSLIHLVFPKYFNWKKDLISTSLINRQMMYVHTFFIALVLFLTGILCLAYSTELLTTRLGSGIVLGLFIFWLFRLLIQFFGYSPLLWRGKKMETIIHIVFSVLWTYISIVFFIAYRINRNS